MPPGFCKICNRISATGQDHIDCLQKQRIEEEEEGREKAETAKTGSTAGEGGSGLGVEIRAILEHLGREKTETD